MHQRTGIGDRDKGDGNPKNPETLLAHRLTHRSSRQFRCTHGSHFRRPLVIARLAEPQQAEGQRHRQRQQCQKGEAAAPADLTDQLGSDERQQHCRDARADERQTERQTALPEEPQVDGARPGDRRRTDTEQADHRPQRIEPEEIARNHRDRGEYQPENGQRTERHLAHAVAIRQPAKRRRQQSAQYAVDGDAETDFGACPAEFLLQRIDEEADGVERQR